ncbi:hypothetical protein WCLP8_5030010 [uncultured Gammaproteobacteria bacterium]
MCMETAALIGTILSTVGTGVQMMQQSSAADDQRHIREQEIERQRQAQEGVNAVNAAEGRRQSQLRDQALSAVQDANKRYDQGQMQQQMDQQQNLVIKEMNGVNPARAGEVLSGVNVGGEPNVITDEYTRQGGAIDAENSNRAQAKSLVDAFNRAFSNNQVQVNRTGDMVKTIGNMAAGSRAASQTEAQAAGYRPPTYQQAPGGSPLGDIMVGSGGMLLGNPGIMNSMFGGGSGAAKDLGGSSAGLKNIYS